MRLLFVLIIFQLRFLFALHVPELIGWQEDAYVDCIFCVDYDSYKRANFNGCQKGKAASCKGNACFMRQHKSSQFFLFTSGCLNLTKEEYEAVAREQQMATRQVGGTGKETLLCEVADKTNTCICRKKPGKEGEFCNNMTIPAQFSEYHTSTLFGNIRFHELLQFRFFMPHTPIFHSVDIQLLDQQLLQSVRGFTFSSSKRSFCLLGTSIIFLFYFL